MRNKTFRDVMQQENNHIQGGNSNTSKSTAFYSLHVTHYIIITGVWLMEGDSDLKKMKVNIFLYQEQPTHITDQIKSQNGLSGSSGTFPFPAQPLLLSYCCIRMTGITAVGEFSV